MPMIFICLPGRSGSLPKARHLAQKGFKVSEAVLMNRDQCAREQKKGADAAPREKIHQNKDC